jgi:hypothetical protein
MFMVKQDETKYPKCTKLISTLDGTLRGRPQVLNAFLKACMADDQFTSSPKQVEAIARKALRWATPPQIVVAQGIIKAVVGGQTNVPTCGWNNGFGTAFGRPTFLEVTSIWFDAFEFGSSFDHDRNADRLTRTVLHETVHWVRDEAGASEMAMDGSVVRGGHFQEAGHLFELWAFGVANICTKAELEDAILSRME